jgi:hypothetical protein
MLRNILFLALVAPVALVPLPAIAQAEQPYVIDRALPAGGSVALDVNVADIRIAPAAEDGHLRLEIETHGFDSPETVKGWVKRFDVNAANATIELELPKDTRENSGPDVALYVPATGDLKVSVGVGDLKINEIRGDKDLHVGVGDLTVELDEPPDYGHVEIATRIGDVDDPLNPSHNDGFLGKSENYVLKGRYHLRATVGVGDVHLVQHTASNGAAGAGDL